MGVRFRRRLFATLSISCCVLLLAGCAVDDEEATKKILANDSSFQKWIDAKKSIQKKLDSVAAVYNEKKRKVETQIGVLKSKKSSMKAEYLESVAKIAKQLEPERRKLKQELVDTHNQLKLKEAESDNTNKDISEVSALIEKQNRLELTREEMQVWNKRRSALIRRKEKVDKERASLREEIEIIKLKIGVLKIKC